MFSIPLTSYEEFRQQDIRMMQNPKTRDMRRLGQRFYDYFKLDKLTKAEDCMHADKIYNAGYGSVHYLIDQVLDKSQ